MELHEALSQISEIRQQMARGQICRGYRSLTAAFSGVAAIVAAVVQAVWVPYPNNDPHSYLYLWAGTALLCLIVVGTEMTLRYRRTESQLHRQTTVAAIEQFVPTLIAGALLTLVIAKSTRSDVWMLPGLWALLFGLGIFASRQVLPRASVWVAQYYVAAGLACLALAQDERALSPWAMGLTFGVGQLLAAGVLYLSVERGYGKESK